MKGDVNVGIAGVNGLGGRGRMCEIWYEVLRNDSWAMAVRGNRTMSVMKTKSGIEYGRQAIQLVAGACVSGIHKFLIELCVRLSRIAVNLGERYTFSGSEPFLSWFYLIRISSDSHEINHSLSALSRPFVFPRCLPAVCALFVLFLRGFSPSFRRASRIVRL